MIQGLLLDMEQMSKEWLSVKRRSEVKILFRKTEPLKSYPCNKNVFDQLGNDSENLVWFFCIILLF